MFEKFRKKPYFFKILIGGLSIIIGVIFIFNLQMSAVKNRKEFFKRGFSSTVIDHRSYQGRSVEFLLANGLKVYFWPKSQEKISVGDLIKKEANTYVYSVYRKDVKGEYLLLSSYDFQRIE